ncbi:DUF1349 domain-containing protein [Saccharibacillus kuerlensis]|uniref:DUF1349 domain-containing protein n=1 Tax=Saccharibacillus kuerlensis TaxID=459527 RepID=A0ABQ2LB45_9BACL|nr:DUF1349 domain-containing protein [Saccharibacillus kuerlensis]GGO09041.1 hypothetical protein GCM10010969_39110 [Saccharibacillus kuerlensis]
MQYIPKHVNHLQIMTEPEKQTVEEGVLKLHTQPDTDFWLKTHYGFERYNGHVLYDEIEGDFEAITELAMNPKYMFDQSGLFVEIDRDNWLKTSVEYIPNGPSHLGAVVTRDGYSDWSTRNVDTDLLKRRLQFKVTREGNDFFIHAREAGREWEQLRIAHLRCPEEAVLKIGLYSASPGTEGGFETSFYSFEINKHERKNSGEAQ